jgi:hypothetical protein
LVKVDEVCPAAELSSVQTAVGAGVADRSSRVSSTATNPPEEPAVKLTCTVVDLETGFSGIVAVPTDDSVTVCAIVVALLDHCLSLWFQTIHSMISTNTFAAVDCRTFTILKFVVNVFDVTGSGKSVTIMTRAIHIHQSTTSRLQYQYMNY